MTDRDIHADNALTIDEVAAMHRVSRRTIERWIANGQLPARKLPGGTVRITSAAARGLLTPVEAEASS